MQGPFAPLVDETAETGDAFYLGSFFRADEEEATEEPHFAKFIQEWFEGANGVYGCHWLLRKALSNCLCERCRADPLKPDARLVLQTWNPEV